MKTRLSVIKNTSSPFGEKAPPIPRDLTELPLFLTPPQIAQLLQISRSAAYALVKSKGFPAVKIGRSVRVYREAFIRWMQENTWEEAK
ncbi:helix-turn-helix domain-containing protein [Desulfofundulus thermosubterraneus]|uniref:Transcriptional regulator, AlpA family n=1 Tax=Desulfofundulus thermosubterraneus DSM 16057 TaxID=1121432 RepID=A0A1M6L3M0_9FIRM|nr:helix-turn-helix domain-containing protein [Desulfofundulus thermosubterraneus]SHJ65763.1 transcriptional regulator, AlpA family [Desulfofundulus thermosubterraneus DSM 16057]